MAVQFAKRKRARRVVLLTYDGGQSLDVTGPLEVFAIANRLHLQREPEGQPPYTLEILAPKGGAVTMSSGLKLVADRAAHDLRGSVDTLIVAGGNVQGALADRSLLSWLRNVRRRTRRLASVCTGAFLLAEAGLLDGKRATTHWGSVALFARRYPRVKVEGDAIFIRDGEVATSAGITAGIDLALSLVEEDLGHAAALAVARQMVVFLKRPGGQSQFSSHLAAQAAERGALEELAGWIAGHPGGDLRVESLAARAAMSPRNFARVFLRELRVTPAKFVEQARVDAARRQLEDTRRSLDEVAAAVGFTSGEQMRRTFVRHLGVLPQEYRRRFQRAA